MGAPNILFTLVVLSYFPVVALCFRRFGPRRGAVYALIGGWLFMPTFHGNGLLPLMHSKAILVPGAIFVVSLLLDAERWQSFRPGWVDVPMIVYGALQLPSAVSNDLGAYEGTAAAFEATMSWVAPYLLGRVYLRDRAAVHEFALAAVIGGLVYVPLCLWEVRMSPNLHLKLYGFATFDFIQSIRFGGYRPAVFMQHGLMTGLFMASVTLVAYWMWRTRAQRTLWNRPFSWAVGALTVTTLLCKSTGAVVLLLVGIATLEGIRRFRSGLLVLVLIAVPPLYCTARIAGWNGETLTELARDAINDDRAASLRYRIIMEDLLIGQALKRPMLGWGRGGGSRLYDDTGKEVTVSDGLWVIVLGMNGYSGLLMLGFALAGPAYLLLRRYEPRHWSDPRLAPAAALAVMVLLSQIDNLLNAMAMPLFPASAGALASLALAPVPASRRPGISNPEVAPARLDQDTSELRA